MEIQVRVDLGEPTANIITTTLPPFDLSIPPFLIRNQAYLSKFVLYSWDEKYYF